MPKDPRVDDYIAKAAPFARPILDHLRALVHHTLPSAEETIKWGMPHFTYKGKNVAGLAAFKAHASFGVHGESATPEGFGQFGKMRSLADIPPEKQIAECLNRAAVRIDETGTALKKRSGKPTAKPEIAVPADFAAALTQEARAFFDKLAPSHRREYLQWIVEAKRPETREKRIGQAAEWLAEGKKRNWKYENC